VTISKFYPSALYASDLTSPLDMAIPSKQARQVSLGWRRHGPRLALAQATGVDRARDRRSPFLATADPRGVIVPVQKHPLLEALSWPAPHD
jgi:hypothetical protein